jgi:ferredoxin
MTMDKKLKPQVVFHLTGRHAEGGPGAVAVSGLRPALMAAYRDLESLRHDFPVIFTGAGDEYVQSLTATVDTALRAVAPPGVAGEALRRRALKVEREICRRVAAGERGSLAELWDRAVEAVVPPGDAAFLKDAAKARVQLAADGEVAGCNAALPARFLRHAWSAVQKEKARVARERIGRLVIRLGDILRADYSRSEAGLAQPALQASFGAAHRGMFDFSAMSRLLAHSPARGGLGERRKRRVEESLAVLRAQRFFPRAGEPTGSGEYEFEFSSAGDALAAFRERLPELARLLKALQAAELEVEGRYVEDLHDPIVAGFDERSVTAEDLQFFPDYLVCLEPGAAGARGPLADALSSGVPLKVLVHADDLLEESLLGQGQFAFGLRATQLASAAMSFDDVFVLQSAASNLLQVRERVQRGLRYAGPALFSVYAAPDGGAVPGYLQAAAAMQSRAFPAFTYDPAAGPDLASRFSLYNNPQPELDWPVERFEYADPDLQTVREEVAFTFADFALCDARCAGHFEPTPRAAWGEGMITAQEWLANPAHDPAAGVPYVLAVDEADLLCRLVVDERLMRAALRCREAWHRLQELGGIHDSRAERLLARERAAWEEAHRHEAATAPAAPVAPAVPGNAAAAPTAAAVPPPPVVEAEPARNPDEPYIETVRCSTCNECTQLNPRMFAYNENKQAYIADLKAGSYKQLVEAAESCQVSIIHPGKPWDPEEPGLEELLERAKPFM